MRDRRGVVLLEVIVALAVLTVGGLVALATISDALRAAERAKRADEELARASAFLDAVALWPREDLDRRLGDRPQGPWRLHIQRPEVDLYLVSLTDSLSEGETILETAIFRPDTVDAGF